MAASVNPATYPVCFIQVLGIQLCTRIASNHLYSCVWLVVFILYIIIFVKNFKYCQYFDSIGWASAKGHSTWKSCCRRFPGGDICRLVVSNEQKLREIVMLVLVLKDWFVVLVLVFNSEVLVLDTPSPVPGPGPW